MRRHFNWKKKSDWENAHLLTVTGHILSFTLCQLQYKCTFRWLNKWNVMSVCVDFVRKVDISILTKNYIMDYFQMGWGFPDCKNKVVVTHYNSARWRQSTGWCLATLQVCVRFADPQCDSRGRKQCNTVALQCSSEVSDKQDSKI